MSGRLFGTDGVRGLANRDLTAELALALSAAAAHVLGDAGQLSTSDSRPTAVVGRDPRASGEFLEAAVVAGLASAGVDVLRRLLATRIALAIAANPPAFTRRSIIDPLTELARRFRVAALAPEVTARVRRNQSIGLFVENVEHSPLHVNNELEDCNSRRVWKL